MNPSNKIPGVHFSVEQARLSGFKKIFAMACRSAAPLNSLRKLWCFCPAVSPKCLWGIALLCLAFSAVEAQSNPIDPSLYSWHSIGRTSISLGVRVTARKIDRLQTFQVTCLLRNDGKAAATVITGRIDTGPFPPRLLFEPKGQDRGSYFAIRGPAREGYMIGHAANFPTTVSLEPGEISLYYDAVLSEPSGSVVALENHSVKVELGGPAESNGLPRDMRELGPNCILLGRFASSEVSVHEEK